MQPQGRRQRWKSRRDGQTIGRAWNPEGVESLLTAGMTEIASQQPCRGMTEIASRFNGWD